MPAAELGEVDRAEALAAGAGLDLRDPQQRAEGGQDGVGLRDRRVDGHLVVADRARPVARAASRCCRRRARGVRRSCAMSLETCRRPSIRPWMRSSMRLSCAASRSNSSPVPRTAIRSPRSPSMIRAAGQVHRLDPAGHAQPQARPPARATAIADRGGPGEGRDDPLEQLLARMRVGADHQQPATWRAARRPGQDRVLLVGRAQRTVGRPVQAVPAGRQDGRLQIARELVARGIGQEIGQVRLAGGDQAAR